MAQGSTKVGKCRQGLTADCGRGFFLYLARRLLSDAGLSFTKPLSAAASVIQGAQPQVFKVALVGSSGVGKTTMMHGLTAGGFLENHEPTSGVTVRTHCAQAHVSMVCRCGDVHAFVRRRVQITYVSAL